MLEAQATRKSQAQRKLFNAGDAPQARSIVPQGRAARAPARSGGALRAGAPQRVEASNVEEAACAKVHRL
jgi:hypothetical protein